MSESPAQEGAPGQRQRTLSVVVADDDVFTASMVASALRALGFDAAQATTVEQAWQWVLEIAVLAFAEAVPRHVNVASKLSLVGIQRCDRAAFIR